MRYTPTLKLSTRLVAFVTVIVISAMFILFIGGTLSFKRIGQEYLDHYLVGIVDVVDKEMEDPDAAYSMQRWMPKMLQASNIVEMKLSNRTGIVYRFKDTSPQIDPSRLYERSFVLERNEGYRIEFKALPPYIGYSYSMEAMWSITLAVALIIFCLIRGVRWLKEQLMGSEMLEERGRMILAGQVEAHAKGDEREWPYTASEALDVLIEELKDARQERSRFDTFIRTHTFLDKLTGTANRVLFDNKLESALHESGARGGVLLIRIDEWEQVCDANDKQTTDSFIIEVGEVLSNIVQRYPDVIFSRYYEADFAVFIPHQGAKDIATLAAQCLRQLDKLTPPEPLEPDNWCHIGVTMYTEGERHSKIMDETETALKSAQLERINNWSRYPKQNKNELDRGSVRWRTLLDKALLPENLVIFAQRCYLIPESGQADELHREIFVRIQDPDKGLLKSSRFMPAVEQVGYQAQMDQSVLKVLLTSLKESTKPTNYSVNLNVTPFASKQHFKWFRSELLQLSAQHRSQLAFEFPEGHLIAHLDYMRPVAKMLKGLGCKIIVGQAGRTIVSTHYIKDLKVNFIKLHRSLIKKIDQRHENQLFVRSLIGACGDSPTQVIAVGVETKQEKNTLIELGINGYQGRYFDEEQQIIPLPNQGEKTVKAESVVKVGRRNRWRKSSS
ncbi:RNase E specificity factor CsrD [Vibrio cyclitrophicus]|uniref:RNase E specificity factor CsrD n=4 Tax=Vibrio cyclitrophicus TaxID=47951 RepID=A0A7Z1MN83_9VIBR|nr:MULTISPECIES: RNase E specificity factor CsrD [Vibrio]KNH12617.1 diguanylate phosphodiesterase [Vibrio lentus]MBY7661355.1 RNase E specificity factor CsrD [Vibrio atlanticus]ERM59670.1 MSHA biogenesis protein MshH [Vibrio cyclitrophicus FF75]KAA8599903.1 MSHA biogenesis protein MshH [Vibrio cyclitrophicus]MBE8555526.1 RNase E specificity factor CsrD [Vibrio sp. OPT24]|tara:strand:- start:2378 stop:4393 length:2016 start_codon:yes stop_codon:yes gene_type:complete